MLKFVAACTERVADTYFWAVAEEGGRAADGELYRKALEYLWQPQAVPDGDAEPIVHQVDLLPELQQEVGPGGRAAFTLDAAVVLYEALSYCASGDAKHVLFCAENLTNSAFLLDKRTQAGVLTEEESTQAEDMAALAAEEITEGDLLSLRQRSREIARRRVNLIRGLP